MDSPLGIYRQTTVFWLCCSDQTIAAMISMTARPMGMDDDGDVIFDKPESNEMEMLTPNPTPSSPTTNTSSHSTNGSLSAFTADSASTKGTLCWWSFILDFQCIFRWLKYRARLVAMVSDLEKFWVFLLVFTWTWHRALSLWLRESDVFSILILDFHLDVWAFFLPAGENMLLL